MALKKWDINRQMASQISDQNANFDELGKFITNINELKLQYKKLPANGETIISTPNYSFMAVLFVRHENFDRRGVFVLSGHADTEQRRNVDAIVNDETLQIAGLVQGFSVKNTHSTGAVHLSLLVIKGDMNL